MKLVVKSILLISVVLFFNNTVLAEEGSAELTVKESQDPVLDYQEGQKDGGDEIAETDWAGLIMYMRYRYYQMQQEQNEGRRGGGTGGGGSVDE